MSFSRCLSRNSRLMMVAGLGMLISLMAGCGQQAAPSAAGRVAVVDVNRIAQTTGFDHQISQKIQNAQHAESTQILDLQKRLGLDKPQAHPPASQAEAQKLAQTQQQFRVAVDQAQQRLESLRESELAQFRHAIRPIAERIANAQGCSIVMEQNQGLLSVDPSSDITDQVIAQMPDVSTGAAPSHNTMPQTILPPTQQGLGQSGNTLKPANPSPASQAATSATSQP